MIIMVMIMLIFIRIIVLLDYKNNDIFINSFLIRLVVLDKVKLVRFVNIYYVIISGRSVGIFELRLKVGCEFVYSLNLLGRIVLRI